MIWCVLGGLVILLVTLFVFQPWLVSTMSEKDVAEKPTFSGRVKENCFALAKLLRNSARNIWSILTWPYRPVATPAGPKSWKKAKISVVLTIVIIVLGLLILLAVWWFTRPVVVSAPADVTPAVVDGSSSGADEPFMVGTKVPSAKSPDKASTTTEGTVSMGTGVTAVAITLGYFAAPAALVAFAFWSWKKRSTWGKKAEVPLKIVLALATINGIVYALFPTFWLDVWADQRLFWTINVGIILAAIFTSIELGFVTWLILLLILIACSLSFYKSETFQNWQESRRQEKAAEKAEAAKQAAIRREASHQFVELEAKPGVWSDKVEIPAGRDWETWRKVSGRVMIKKNDLFEREDGPDKVVDLGNDVQFLRFKSLETGNVKVRLDFYLKNY